MLFLPISAILALGLPILVKGYGYYDDITDEDTYEDYEDRYHDGDETLPIFRYEDSTVNRVRRYERMSAIKTLGPEDEREVRGALKQLLSGIAVENPFTPFITATYSDYQSTQYSTSTSPATYDSTLNTTDSTISSTYFSKLITEIYRFTKSVPTRSKQLLRFKNIIDRRIPMPPPDYGDNSTSTMWTTTTITFQRRPDLDIPRLLAIISDLASEFETNLTRKLNRTLITMTLPECTTPTTVPPIPPITSKYESHYAGSIISKCFVCGLSINKIPKHAHCADAFAGDFLPLVPVDSTAKGKLARFKKYCKYASVNGYSYNNSEPRVLMGRWTGGCSVRWIDLSGIYTQRTCRNRIQPTMGRHFASKRMAKLERALWNVENGCIISPMATLVPLSRGISLYARFHACVCTGSWCNISGLTAPCITFIVIVSGLLYNLENGCIVSPMTTLVTLLRGISLYARLYACVCTGSWCNVIDLTTPCITLIVTVSFILTVITTLERIIF